MFHLPVISATALVGKRPERKPTWSTMCMTWVLLLVFTLITGGFESFFPIAGNFFSGDLAAVREYGATAAAPTIAAAVVVLVPVMLGVLLLLQKWATAQADDSKSPRYLFAIVMCKLVAEELSRYFFLGGMTRIPGFGGSFSFYLLSFCANVFWTLLHLQKFTDIWNYRKLIMVFPQFLVGICFTMIYASHGFFAALMVHMIYDMVLFSTDCRILFKPSRLVLSLYHLIFLGVFVSLSFVLGNHSLWDVVDLGDSSQNWTFGDYFWLVGVLTAGVALLLELLWYDLERPVGKKDFLFSLGCYGVFLVLSYPLIAFFPGNFVIKVIVVSFLMTFLEKTTSRSGVARLFWKSLLITSMVVVVVQSTGRGVALLLLIPYLLHQLGERVIRIFFGSWSKIQRLDIAWISGCHMARLGFPLHEIYRTMMLMEMQYRSSKSYIE
jgi:hypothetical protein